jgi:DNA-binding Lrp family transcriptional regulator
MDKLDYQIIAELHKDGAMSYVDIAKNVKSTPNKVRRRYEKLRRDSIIFGSSAIIDLSRMGYQGKTFIMVNLVDSNNKADTMNYLVKIKNVIGVSQVLGPCDLIAIAFSTDLASIQTLLAEARKAPNIQKVDFYCIDDTYFPLTPNFNSMLNQKCREIADTL